MSDNPTIPNALPDEGASGKRTELWRVGVAAIVAFVALALLYALNAPALPKSATASTEPQPQTPVMPPERPGVYAADANAILRHKSNQSLEPQELDLAGVDAPLLVPAGEAQLPDVTTVVGIDVDGQARAYKLEEFVANKVSECGRHIVKDVVGGRVHWVTHCDRTRETRVVTMKQGFDPLELRVGGFNEGLLLRVGDRPFRQMDPNISALADVPFTICSWKEWRDAHPETLVYDGRTQGESGENSSE